VDSEALKRRILQGEDSSREFKSAVKAGFRLDPDTVAKEIAALANSGGGELIIGVEDDGTVTGLGDSISTRDVWSAWREQSGRDLCLWLPQGPKLRDVPPFAGIQPLEEFPSLQPR
jgi:predicted HTH transcriptional regulator